MSRTFLLAGLLFALPARAVEGFYVSLDGGLASWTFDEPRLAEQLGAKYGPAFGAPLAREFVGQLVNGPAAAFRLGYNIAGHASVEFFFQAAGWEVTSADRGGGGFSGLAAAWHPLQLFLPDRTYDVAFGLGGGYGLAGEDRAMDGGAMAFTFEGEWQPAPFMALTAGVRWVRPLWTTFITDWDTRNSGGSVQLDESAPGSALFPHLGVKFIFQPRT